MAVKTKSALTLLLKKKGLFFFFDLALDLICLIYSTTVKKPEVTFFELLSTLPWLKSKFTRNNQERRHGMFRPVTCVAFRVKNRPSQHRKVS